MALRIFRSVFSLRRTARARRKSSCDAGNALLQQASVCGPLPRPPRPVTFNPTRYDRKFS